MICQIKIFSFIISYFLVFTAYAMEVRIPELHELSFDEKIGQLMMVACTSSSVENQIFMQCSPYHLDQEYVERMIKEYHVGGVIFLGSGVPNEQYAVTKKLQSLSRYPLLIGLDAEWGLAMRHQEQVTNFPRAMTLGALSSDDEPLIYKMGMVIAHHCQALGVHINFAPVVDVNNNPNNPVINTRSFGDCPEKVAKKAALYMRGMRDAGILACAKHFPGHGDTHVDSHHARGILTHSQERMHSIELAPFKHMINANSKINLALF